MANAHDSTSMEISPAAAAIIASTAKEVAEQQAMNDALEAQIQDGVQELLRVSGTCPLCLNKRPCSIASLAFYQHPLTSS